MNERKQLEYTINILKVRLEDEKNELTKAASSHKDKISFLEELIKNHEQKLEKAKSSDEDKS